jgi:transposase
MSQKERDRLKVISDVDRGLLKQREAAALLRLSVRQVRRIQRRYEAEGDAGLIHRSRGAASPLRIAQEVRQKAVARIEEVYEDFGPTLASEKLAERDGIEVSRETVRQWMIEASLWKPRQRKVKPCQWRERRPCVGELVQMDTSIHEWFEGRGEQAVLIAMIDDASSWLYARFFDTDSTRTNMLVIRDYLRRRGRPVAIYADRASHFKTTREPTVEEMLRDVQPETQIARALRELDIEYIPAHSPQAKGRIERAFGIMQDRLVKELRLEGIATIEAANRFLKEQFIPFWNRRFIKEPASPAAAHRSRKGYDLNAILSVQVTRTVRNDYTIQLNNARYQIEKKQVRPGLRKAKVTVELRLDGTMRLRWKNRYLKFHRIEQPTESKTKSAAAKAVGPRPPALAAKPKHKPAPDHPWRGRNRTLSFCRKPDISTLR